MNIVIAVPADALAADDTKPSAEIGLTTMLYVLNTVSVTLCDFEYFWPDLWVSARKI